MSAMSLRHAHHARCLPVSRIVAVCIGSSCRWIAPSMKIVYGARHRHGTKCSSKTRQSSPTLPNCRTVATTNSTNQTSSKSGIRPCDRLPGCRPSTQLNDGKMAASLEDEQSSRVFDVSWGSYEHSMHLEKLIIVHILEQNQFIL